MRSHAKATSAGSTRGIGRGASSRTCHVGLALALCASLSVLAFAAPSALAAFECRTPRRAAAPGRVRRPRRGARAAQFSLNASGIFSGAPGAGAAVDN